VSVIERFHCSLVYDWKQCKNRYIDWRYTYTVQLYAKPPLYYSNKALSTLMEPSFICGKLDICVVKFIDSISWSAALLDGNSVECFSGNIPKQVPSPMQNADRNLRGCCESQTCCVPVLIVFSCHLRSLCTRIHTVCYLFHILFNQHKLRTKEALSRSK